MTEPNELMISLLEFLGVDDCNNLAIESFRIYGDFQTNRFYLDMTILLQDTNGNIRIDPETKEAIREQIEVRLKEAEDAND